MIARVIIFVMVFWILLPMMRNYNDVTKYESDMVMAMAATRQGTIPMLSIAKQKTAKESDGELVKINNNSNRRL